MEQILSVELVGLHWIVYNNEYTSSLFALPFSVSVVSGILWDILTPTWEEKYAYLY